MEQTNTPQQPSRKKAILSLLVLLALTCVVVFIFSSHWAEISTALAQLSFWQVLLVLAIGLTYPLLEGIVCWLIIRCRLPGFTLRRGMDAAFVGIFGNVVGLGAGAVPMESYYLYHCGLPLGPGVGLMTLQYVFHKTTVLLYATVMLLLQHRWLAANTSGVMHYLPAAYCVVALVIVALVLLCVSPLVQRLARWAMGFLPKTEPWQTRREKWLEQLDTLAAESRLLLADKGRCARILAVQTLKLFLMFTLPWFCIHGEQEANRIYREPHRQQSLTPSLFEQEFIAALNRLTAEKQWTTKSAVVDEVCCKLEKSERTIDSRFREFQPRLNDLGYTWKRISQADVEATGIALPIGRYAIFRNLIAPSQASVSVCTEAERRHY